MPVFIAKYNEIREEKAKDFDQEESAVDASGLDDLLGTIKVPTNLKLLRERLPKSNYGNLTKLDQPSNYTEAATASQMINQLDQSEPSKVGASL
jgi:hypothetical protein